MIVNSSSISSTGVKYNIMTNQCILYELPLPSSQIPYQLTSASLQTCTHAAAYQSNRYYNSGFLQGKTRESTHSLLRLLGGSFTSSSFVLAWVYWLVDDGEYPGALGEYPALGLCTQQRWGNFSQKKQDYTDFEYFIENNSLTYTAENSDCNPGLHRSCCMGYRKKESINQIKTNLPRSWDTKRCPLPPPPY